MNDTLYTVYASVWLYPLIENPDYTFVFEVQNSDDEQVYWNGKNTAKMNLHAKKWQKLNAAFNIAPEDYRKFQSEDRLCIYVVNNSRAELYADDFTISYGNISEPEGGQPFVDLNSLDGSAYIFNRNHPPYPISFNCRFDIG